MENIMNTHAQKINSLYEVSTSNFVTLQERLEKALAKAPFFKSQLEAVVDEFRRRNCSPPTVRGWTKFADINICEAIQVPFNKIQIDETMQREVNMRHILKILSYFSESMVMAIQVYEDPDNPDNYIAWDGQHTSIALHIILTKVFGERAATAMVPVVVYSSKQKLEIRRNFILLNGEAKETLDFIDTYRQQVFGAKVDGADYQEWLDTALKNDYFAEAGLFATHAKFGDEDEPGAFTLLADTLMSKSLKTRKDPEVTRMFSQYWAYLNEARPVRAKEARQLYEYFNLCFEQGITVDNDYLLKMVAFTKEFFEANFGEDGVFWDKVKMAYTRWYAQANTESYAEFGLKGFTTEMRAGIPFLIAQMRKSTDLATPKYTPNNGFTVVAEDLWS
jgi:hypothetical protein